MTVRQAHLVAKLNFLETIRTQIFNINILGYELLRHSRAAIVGRDRGGNDLDVGINLGGIISGNDQISRRSEGVRAGDMGISAALHQVESQHSAHAHPASAIQGGGDRAGRIAYGGIQKGGISRVHTHTARRIHIRILQVSQRGGRVFFTHIQAKQGLNRFEQHILRFKTHRIESQNHTHRGVARFRHAHNLGVHPGSILGIYNHIAAGGHQRAIGNVGLGTPQDGVGGNGGIHRQRCAGTVHAAPRRCHNPLDQGLQGGIFERGYTYSGG